MNALKKDISVIIPCYNTPPAYLQEAIGSVQQNCGNINYEIILVNDGSTDPATLAYLDSVPHDTRLVSQENKGLAAARNTGIKNAAADIVFFLDGDDRVKPGYISRGLEILAATAAVGVVYAKADAFGDGSRANLPAAPFDIASLLINNHVPSCVVMRKKACEEAGGFDETLRKFEDWELWIRVYKAGWQFHFIDEALFEYRIQQNSLIGGSGQEAYKKMIEYIYKKHWDLVFTVFHQLYASRVMYQQDMARPSRSFLKYLAHHLTKSNRKP